jgi:hypothetical protein
VHQRDKEHCGKICSIKKYTYELRSEYRPGDDLYWAFMKQNSLLVENNEILAKDKGKSHTLCNNLQFIL